MINALIIDDEDGARTTLRKLLETYAEDINVVGESANVPDGVLKINKLNPDLIFLDIEMPEYNGFELFDFFKKINFEVVFVTAYNQYAIRAFEVSAIDYVLKPVDVEHLLNAIKKVKVKLDQKNLIQRIDLFNDFYKGNAVKKIAIPLKDGLTFVNINEILFVEADRAYSKIFLNNGSKYTVSKPMRIFEDILIDHPAFFRPHRSFLINLNHITKYNRGESLITMENNSLIAISRDKKQSFEHVLKELKLSI